jgi:hypothetical protein
MLLHNSSDLPLRFFVSLRVPWWASFVFPSLIASLLINGCGSPSAANILLRKQNQDLQDKVDQLTQQHSRDVQTLEACQRSHPTTMQLAPERLAKLTTTHGLSFGQLSGGDNPDSTQEPDTQLKVFVVPVDADGTPIKAAGSFKVEAYDLDDPAKPLLGTWNFSLDATHSSFYSQLGMYTYVLVCPLKVRPIHPHVTMRVSFDDALTGWQFVDQVQGLIHLQPPRP